MDEHGRWSWSSGSAKLAFFAAPSADQTYEISFIVETLLPRSLDVTVAGKRVAALKLVPGQFQEVRFKCHPRDSDEHRTFDGCSGQQPPNGDPRVVAFRVINPEVV